MNQKELIEYIEDRIKSMRSHPSYIEDDVACYGIVQGMQECLDKIKNSEIKNCCSAERPLRKTFCQLEKGHEGSHRAVIFWEGKK